MPGCSRSVWRCSRRAARAPPSRFAVASCDAFPLTLAPVPFRTAAIFCLLVGFLVAALTPCPGSSAVRAADVSGSMPVSSDGDPDELRVVAACPCGCERPPIAGASARLPVVLLTDAPHWIPASAAVSIAALVSPTPPLFVSRIEHVPLSASP